MRCAIFLFCLGFGTLTRGIYVERIQNYGVGLDLGPRAILNNDNATIATYSDSQYHMRTIPIPLVSSVHFIH